MDPIDLSLLNGILARIQAMGITDNQSSVYDQIGLKAVDREIYVCLSLTLSPLSKTWPRARPHYLRSQERMGYKYSIIELRPLAQNLTSTPERVQNQSLIQHTTSSLRNCAQLKIRTQSSTCQIPCRPRAQPLILQTHILLGLKNLPPPMSITPQLTWGGPAYGI